MSQSTKERIIIAAAKTAVQEGIQNMTMEAVAAAAGISKGGLFYHFSSKQHLLLEMSRALAKATEDEIEATQAVDQGVGSWLRGFLKASTTEDETGPTLVGQLSVAFLIAAASDKSLSLLEPLEEKQEEWREKINNCGIDPALAQIIRLAADGLWINDTVGLKILDQNERSMVISRLEQMTRECKSEPVEDCIHDDEDYRRVYPASLQ